MIGRGRHRRRHDDHEDFDATEDNDVFDAVERTDVFDSVDDDTDIAAEDDTGLNYDEGFTEGGNIHEGEGFAADVDEGSGRGRHEAVDEDVHEDVDQDFGEDVDEDFDEDLGEDVGEDFGEDLDEELDEEDVTYSDDDTGGAAPKHPNSLKWGLVAVTLLAIVAIALVAVVLLGGDPGKDAATGGSSKSSAAASGIASANDTGPVSVIIDDPTCVAWGSISSNLANTLSLLGRGEWNERDQSIPASDWDQELKKGYMAAGQVIRTASAQTVGLVKLTPHRVMRELYEQFIAYGRAFVESIPHYTAADANLAGTAHSAASALAAICGAAASGAAAARGPLVEAQTAPARTAPPGNPTSPQRYLTAPNPVCRDWSAALEKFGADTAEWQDLDPNVPATYWNPQQKQVNIAVGSVMIAYANKLQQLGRRSDNLILNDFADLSAAYRRAFVLALPTYDPSDNYLANAASYTSTVTLGACQSASTVR